jgi:hypothetical protein
MFHITYPRVLGVWFPLGRVNLGHACVWYVFGGRIGPGNLVLRLAGAFVVVRGFVIVLVSMVGWWGILYDLLDFPLF